MFHYATGSIYGKPKSYHSVNSYIMRRSLVLTTEGAGHSFRASLPPHVFSSDRSEEDPDVIDGKPTLWLTMEDMRGVASAYFATFAAALVFLA